MVKEIRGSLSGTAALNSQFIVSPTNSKAGCSEISALVIQAKKLKSILRENNYDQTEYEEALKEVNSKLRKYF